MQRGRHPKISEGEVFLCFGVQGGAERELLDGPVLGSDHLIDGTMIYHVLLVFSGGPGKDEYVMPLSRFDLSECAVANFLYRNEVHCHPGIVLLAPIVGDNVYKPLIKFRDEVRPFGDLQSLLAGESVR